MAMKIFNVTLGAAATQITATRTPFQELHIEVPSGGHTTFVGDSSVTSSNYGRSVAAGAAIIIGNGPGAFKVDDLSHVYLAGTQNDVIHVLVLTL